MTPVGGGATGRPWRDAMPETSPRHRHQSSGTHTRARAHTHTHGVRPDKVTAPRGGPGSGRAAAHCWRPRVGPSAFAGGCCCRCVDTLTACMPTGRWRRPVSRLACCHEAATSLPFVCVFSVAEPTLANWGLSTAAMLMCPICEGRGVTLMTRCIFFFLDYLNTSSVSDLKFKGTLPPSKK